jgi:hypothetical protein
MSSAIKPQVITATNFDIKNLKFGAIKDNSGNNGGKSVNISYLGGPLMIQTPKMTAPYGVNRWENNNGVGAAKLSIDLSFGDMEQNPDYAAFYNMCKQLNEAFINEGLQNSNAWFKKKHNSTDVIEALYTNLIKFSKDKTTGEPSTVYPPTFKVNLPQTEGGNTFTVYDAKKEQIELDSVDLKGAEVRIIMVCSGIWIAGGKFGCTWRAQQMQVIPRLTKIKDFAFVEETD